MRKHIIPFVIVLSCTITFAYGVASGRFKLFPYEYLEQTAYRIVRSDLGNAITGLIRMKRNVEKPIHQIPTNMVTLDVQQISLPFFGGSGGGIHEVGNKIIFVTPHGRIGWINLSASKMLFEPHFLETRVPMNLDGLKASEIARDSRFDVRQFRVAGIYAELNETTVRLYIFHHYYHGECISLRLGLMILGMDHDTLRPQSAGVRTLFETKPCISPNYNVFTYAGNQIGGRIIRDAPQSLLIGVGDLHLDGVNADRRVSQDPRVPYGKIIRFLEDSGDWRIVASGIRNPQGLFRDKDGIVWETEHGPQGGDELNIVVEGEDYGWPEVTLGLQYGSKPWPLSDSQGHHTKGKIPIYTWVPSIGISNLTQVQGQEFPLWTNDLIVASLGKLTLYRLRIHDGHVLYAEPIHFGERIRDIVTLRDGRIALMTDNSSLYILSNSASENARGKSDLEANTIPIDRPLIPEGDELVSELLFQTKCGWCHRMDDTSEIAPSLRDVVGREIGSLADVTYSTSMRDSNDHWTRETLSTYVLDPQEVFPGSKMSAIAITRAEVNQIIDYLDGY